MNLNNIEFYLNYSLLLVTSFIDIINRYIQINNLEEDVIFTDFVDRGELLYLINNSIALVQPSLYEGGPGGFS